MRKIFLALALSLLAVDVAAPTEALAAPTAQPASSIATGRYVLTLHVTLLDGKPVKTVTKDIPVVVASSGNTFGIGGKRGPQVMGQSSGYQFAAHGVNPQLGQVIFTGTGKSTTGSLTGTFSWSQNGKSLGGGFSMNPYVPGTGSWENGSGHTGSWNNSPSMNGTPQTPGSHASGAPGMANGGPNLGGTPVGGQAAGDGHKIKDFDQTQKDKADKDKGDDKSFTDTLKDMWNGLHIGGGDSGNADGGSTKKPPKDDGSGGNTGGDDGAMDDRQRDYGGGVNKLGATKVGGGQDKGGGKSTDRGGQDSGGKNAQGQSISKSPNKGDNPFEVTGSDVLNQNHLVDPAKDPVFGPGSMATTAQKH